MTESPLTIAALLCEVRDEIRELRADLAGRQRGRLSPADRDVLAGLLPIVGGLWGSAEWTVAELYARAGLAAGSALGTSLGTLSPKQCGKLLLRAHGVPIRAYCVKRIGHDGRNGALWQVLADLALPR